MAFCGSCLAAQSTLWDDPVSGDVVCTLCGTVSNQDRVYTTSGASLVSRKPLDHLSRKARPCDDDDDDQLNVPPRYEKHDHATKCLCPTAEDGDTPTAQSSVDLLATVGTVCAETNRASVATKQTPRVNSLVDRLRRTCLDGFTDAIARNAIAMRWHDSDTFPSLYSSNNNNNNNDTNGGAHKTRGSDSDDDNGSLHDGSADDNCSDDDDSDCNDDNDDTDKNEVGHTQGCAEACAQQREMDEVAGPHPRIPEKRRRQQQQQWAVRSPFTIVRRRLRAARLRSLARSTGRDDNGVSTRRDKRRSSVSAIRARSRAAVMAQAVAESFGIDHARLLIEIARYGDPTALYDGDGLALRVALARAVAVLCGSPIEGRPIDIAPIDADPARSALTPVIRLS